MVSIITRSLGALLALAGIALTVLGVWFALALGGDGTAEFTARPDTGEVVVLPPEVLNRVDSDVTVTATPSEGAGLFMARANPSDAAAVLGDAPRVEVTGVEVRDWLLTTRSAGSGEAPTLAAADLWRQTDEADGPLTFVIEQQDAPETVVVRSPDGEVASLTFTVSDKRWFVEAVVAALVGLFLLVLGLIALWPRRSRPTVSAVPTVPSSAPREEVAP